MNTQLFLQKADITNMQVDAIVNAANSSLMGGGGVDGAIHRAGGSAILDECKKIIASQGSCKTGEAVITTAGKLPSRYVIHTVGPVWNHGKNQEAEKLSACYSNSLMLTVQHPIKSIAFPNISTGIYGYPKKEAASIAVQTVKDWLLMNQSDIQVYFVCFDDENYRLYQEIFATTI